MLIELENTSPKLGDNVFLAPNATVIGDVTIGDNASVWFNAVVRGDINKITIGSYTNIQDLAMIHTPSDLPVEIGDHVTVGHKALIHGCKIGSYCLIGMGSIIMDGAEIGNNCIVAAGAVVTQGTTVPSGTLVVGMPAKPKRELTSEELGEIQSSAKRYFEYARLYRQLDIGSYKQ